MSDTPRTDAMLQPVQGRDCVTGDPIDVVHADDCRAMERDLNEYRQTLEYILREDRLARKSPSSESEPKVLIVDDGVSAGKAVARLLMAGDNPSQPAAEGTPRTDEMAEHYADYGCDFVLADFARTLERELAEAEAELERRQAKLMRLQSVPASAIRDTDWEDCRRCGAAILKEHPRADPEVVRGQAESASPEEQPTKEHP